jgi:hypothetical protein
MPNRRVEIPKGNGKVRLLQIPCIRDRVVQGAVKLILEAVFEADFCSNSYGFRPQRSPHHALAEVRRTVLFDTIRHSVLLDKIARRIQDPQVQRKRAAHSDLDSPDRLAAEMAASPFPSHWSLSNLASLLRLNLFTYRELRKWLDDPLHTPPLIRRPEQLTLQLA